MTRTIVLIGMAASLAACQQSPSPTGVSRPAGLEGALPSTAAPLSPDPGTYDGRNVANPLPPRSGLNSDPDNPSGAPGNYAPNTTSSAPGYRTR